MKKITPQKQAWLLAVLVPASLLFAIGAKVGWWLIEKDAGRWLRDTGEITPDITYLQSALYVGLLFALAGALLGVAGRTIFLFGKRLLRRPGS